MTRCLLIVVGLVIGGLGCWQMPDPGFWLLPYVAGLMLVTGAITWGGVVEPTEDSPRS